MLTLGSDVEVFLCHRQTRELASAVGLIGGTKQDPKWYDEGNLQEDNVLAEYAILPSSTEEEFVQRNKAMQDRLSELLPDMRHLFDSSNVMPEECLMSEEALQFGCDPDFNAWTATYNESPDPYEVGGLRTAGGHIHIGFTDGNEQPVRECIMLARACDVHLGLPSLLVDQDNRRRELYGAAGCFRRKPYGIEYRSLSNFWAESEELTRWAYNAAHRAYNMYVEWGRGLLDLTTDVQTAINTNDVDMAVNLMGLYGVEHIHDKRAA